MDHRLALLIDADNNSFRDLEHILSEAGKHGKINIRRAYGDFTQPNMQSWRDPMNSYSIRPMQKFTYAAGKNSTDTAMIIDAMDIMHDNLVTGFCIISSDSDYTGLALRLRESGLFVLGIGRATTPTAFQRACETFVFLENLTQTKRNTQQIIPEQPNKNPVQLKAQTENKSALVSKITKQPINTGMIDTAIEMALEQSGRAYLGTIGEKLHTLDPAFDVRSYGFSSLAALFKSMPDKYQLTYTHNNSAIFITML